MQKADVMVCTRYIRVEADTSDKKKDRPKHYKLRNIFKQTYVMPDGAEDVQQMVILRQKCYAVSISK